MVFAAGVGSRLKPFTLEHPKALAPVAGVPAIERVMRRLVAAGVDEIVVNVHHFADQVVDFVTANNGFGVTVHFSDETGHLLETGGGIVKASDWLEGDTPFIVHNADIVTTIDLADMYRRHVECGADVTLLATPRKTSRHFFFDKASNRLTGWDNAKTGEYRPADFRPDDTTAELAFGGVHVISPRVLGALKAYAPADTAFSITPFYVDNCRTLNIQAYTPAPGSFVWADIGTPESLQAATQLINAQ